MSIVTAAVLASASKTGRTVSLVLDAYGGATSTFVYDSSAAVTNGYVARIDPDGTYTPLNGGVGTPLGPNPAFSGNATIAGTLGITPASNSQTALTISAPAAGTVDAVDIYVGATRKIWVDNTGQLNAAVASIANLTITTAITLPGPLSIAQGGTGTASPAFSNGSNVSITGSFPNYTVGVVASPSFGSVTVAGNVTFPAAGTATSGGNFASAGALTYGTSLWNGSAAVSHTWQLITESTTGNIQYLYDGVCTVAFPGTAGGFKVKNATGTSNAVTFGTDGSGVFAGAISATALTLSTTPLAVSSGGTGTASPAFSNGSNVSITGSFPNYTVGVVASPSFSSLTLSATPLAVSSGGTGTTSPSLVGTSGVLTVTGSFPNQTLNLAHGDYADIVNAQTIAGAKTFSSAVTAKGLTLQDATDATKQASFVVSSIATATTRSFTLPNVNGTLVTTGDSGSVTSTMLAGSIAVGKLSALTASRAVITDSSGFLSVGAGLPVTVADTGTVTNTMLAGSIAITKLLASTISGVSLGNTLFNLSFGTYLTGTSYNGSAAVTIATNAVSTNTASTLVARDSFGGFSAAAIVGFGPLKLNNSSVNFATPSSQSSSTELVISGNQSGTAAIDFYNTYSMIAQDTTPAYTWNVYDNAGTPANYQIMKLVRQGDLTVAGKFLAGSSTYGPTSATINGTVTATNFVATSGTILLSCSTAAAGTGYYFDTTNAAIRASGGLYLQGPSGTGALNIVQVGSITASGGITTTSYILAGTGPGSTNAGDVTAARSTTSGAYFFGGTAATYGALLYDGSNYYFYGPGATSIKAQISASTGAFSIGSSTYGATSASINGALTVGGSMNVGNSGSTATGPYLRSDGTNVILSAKNGGTIYLGYDMSSFGGLFVGVTGGLGSWTSTGISVSAVAFTNGNNSDAFTFPANTGSTTYVGSNGGSSVAGISATVLKIYNAGNILAMNAAGDMGISGSYFAVSHSSHKTGIREIDFDPIDVIKRTTVRHFNYKHDPDGHEERLGLIADESPAEMMGPTQDRHDFMRTIAVLIAANKALIAKHEALEVRVKDLEARCAS